MRNKIIISIINILFIMASLCGCASYKESKVSFSLMDTFMTVTVYDKNQKKADECANGCRDLIQKLDEKLSAQNENSEIAKLNTNGSSSLEKDTYELLKSAVKYSDLTEGAFDITIYPLVKLWGFGDNPKVPYKDDIVNSLSKVDYKKITFDQNNTVTLGQDQAIDLGAIAKGYASDRVIEYLKAQGIESAIISLGGNIYCLGKKNGKDSWNIAVENPVEGSDDFLCTLKVNDKAVVSSGGYIRNFTENGITYHHILEPKTGYPAGDITSSVTIISSNGTLADALSTGCFVLGREKAFELWNSHSDEFSIIWYENGQLWVSEDIASNVSSNMHFNTLKRY